MNDDARWDRPAAMAIPMHDDSWPVGKYGPVRPRTPACYGFTLIANVKPGTADTIREHGVLIAAALKSRPDLLAPLKLHYLRWVLFDNDTRFMSQDIFDTDFDKYAEDALELFKLCGAIELNVAFTALLIGSSLLLLSAFWHQAREAVVKPLPDSLRAKLPLLDSSRATAQAA